MKKVLLTSAAVLAVFASSAAVFANDGNVHTGNLITKLKQLVVTSSQTTKVVLLKLLKMVLTTLTQIQLNKNLKMLVNTSNQNVMLTETSSKMSL
ncbi:MAG: hypothetical protein ACLS36_03455 [Streptococcus sp.]